MRRQLHWILIAAATATAVLPPLLSDAQPLPPTTPQTPPRQGELTITLQGLEARLLPVAIPAFRGSGGDAVSAVVSNDLRLSALFRVLDARSFTADLDAEGLNINAPSWVGVGATAVVKAQVTGNTGRGGRGGDGGDGGDGGSGGNPGSGGGATGNAGSGGAGARGGNGGDAGSGSGAPGGPSVCVYYLGAAPMISGLTCMRGGGGSGGGGGRSGTLGDAPNGATGLSEDVRAGM